MIGTVEVVEDASGLAERAAEIVARASFHALTHRDRFRIALAGGGTPRAAYERLAAEPRRSRVDWSRWDVFFGDERCVGPEDEASNDRMAREALLDRVPIPPGRIHRIRGEAGPDEAARLYEETLRAAFPRRTWPRLNLVLLGLGEDGHTASLFPGAPALAETDRWVVGTRSPKPPPHRVTLTLPVLERAHRIVFLVCGAGKAEALRRIRAGEDLPASRLRPVEGALLWLVDRAAWSDGG